MGKKIIALFIAAVLGVCSITFAQDTKILDLAGKAFSELSDGNYTAFHSRFDEKMTSVMPVEQVKEMWDAILIQSGTFKSQIGIRQEKSDGYDIVIITCQFEKMSLDITLVFNTQRQMSGLFFRPAVTTEEKRPQNPVKPYPYREEEVTYESKEPGVKLVGTLTLPDSGGPFSAVLLITGSGSQDRNEEIMGHKPFLVLADHLTRKGIAVLRVDDRGVGGSSPGTIEPSSLNFAQDVMGGVSYLKSRKEINPKWIGLIGHSEGGIIAPMVAAQSSDIAFIVMMAGTGVSGDEILTLQSELIMKANGASEELVQENIKAQKILYEIMRSTPDNEEAEKKMREAVSGMNPVIRDAVHAQLKPTLSAWMRYFITYDPQETLGKVKCPVLAINGEKDLQVSPRQNLPAIEKALRAGGNKDYKTMELQGLNHLFQTCKIGSVSEYSQIDETISPAVLELISSWIHDHVH
jgi:uncharacterized protein